MRIPCGLLGWRRWRWQRNWRRRRRRSWRQSDGVGMRVRDQSWDWDGARWRGDDDGEGDGNGAAEREWVRETDNDGAGSESEWPELRPRWNGVRERLSFFERADCECGRTVSVGMREFFEFYEEFFFLEDCECGKEWESFLRVEFFWETRLSDAWQKRKHKSSPMDLISIYKKWVH